MDLPSPFADPLSSFLLSHSTAAADTGEPEPALHVNIKAPLPASSSQSLISVAQVKVLVQPLQLQYQPSCFARLAKILATPTGRSRTAELMDVITAHDSLEVQSLSIAELACGFKPLPAVSLEVDFLFQSALRCSFIRAKARSIVERPRGTCSNLQ